MTSLLGSSLLPFPLAALPAVSGESLSLTGEICTYLEAQSLSTPLNYDGDGTVNLFDTFLPDTPDTAVAVIARPGIAPVSILTGLGLGVIEGLTKVFWPQASATVIFFVMVIVLLWRPAGLFGKGELARLFFVRAAPGLRLYPARDTARP